MTPRRIVKSIIVVYYVQWMLKNLVQTDQINSMLKSSSKQMGLLRQYKICNGNLKTTSGHEAIISKSAVFHFRVFRDSFGETSTVKGCFSCFRHIHWNIKSDGCPMTLSWGAPPGIFWAGWPLKLDRPRLKLTVPEQLISKSWSVSSLKRTTRFCRY